MRGSTASPSKKRAPFLPTRSRSRIPDESHEEERWITIGNSQRQRLLVVVHSEGGGNIRLISARKATAMEREAYEEA